MNHICFSQLIHRLVTIDRIKRNVKLIEELPFLNNIIGRLEISKEVEFIEKSDGSEIDITYSSSFVSILYIFAIMVNNEYFQGNNLLLIDNIDSYLHSVKGQDMLALMLWKLTETGTTIVITTHDLLFVNLLMRAKNIARHYGAKVDVDLDKMSIIELKPWEKCEKYKPLTSWIDTYSVVMKYLNDNN